MFEAPSPANGFHAGHVQLLRQTLRRWTGIELIAGNDADAGRWLFEAPFVVLSHDTQADPVFTYGNRAALTLFELNWRELVHMPSRLSAEPLARPERTRLLDQVTVNGFIDDYAGVRVSRTGKRFRISTATVWTLITAAGSTVGQAAMFAEWVPLAPR
ncbi:MAG: MEKHLA domain-containing protein [Rhodospirillales bacterium]|nr:MEKHLA domain-containing protein [Rhodospirillales bacterium]